MTNDYYNFKELDYLLRDTISMIKAQADYLCIGGIEEMTGPDRDEYFLRLQLNINNLYESINHNIIVKAKQLNELMKEVVETKEKLETERNELKKRNNIIEQDLKFAKNIQRQIIPNKISDPRIGVFYKPMDQLGGDFFDLIQYRETDKIGFFISDVSGHGIPASLVTTVIKSLLLQQRFIENNPSAILKAMNDILITMIDGNFVTAFLGTINLKDGILNYCNAGHNSPILITEKGISYIEQKNKCIPLAVMDQEDLVANQKTYQNETFQLEPGSKLFLYTDGLTEATPIKDDNLDFETVLLEKAVMKNRHLPAPAFLEKIYQNLTNFRGSNEFDDDICMICFDYIK